MSVTQSISNRIKRMPKGKPFVGSVFAWAGSRGSVSKALSRMVLSGCLERVVRGVYIRPKQSKYTGKGFGRTPLQSWKRSQRLEARSSRSMA